MTKMSNQPYYNGYIYHYNIPIFDDLHNYFPDLLYAPLERFGSARDILMYIREQVRLRGDRYSAGQRQMQQYYTVPVAPPPYFNVTPPVAHTPPVAQTPLQPTIRRQVPLTARTTTARATAAPTNDYDFVESLLNIFAQPTATIGIFGTTLADTLSPVQVSPSNAQIEAATTEFVATAAHTDQQCTICFEYFAANNNLRKINHCQHTFHKQCIDRWFQTNVHCPNCRHDIRDTTPDSSYEDDDNSDSMY